MTSALKIVTDEPIRPLYTINIYNTDDALTQSDWAKFQQDIKRMICGEIEGTQIHGIWYTPAIQRYQSMSISFNLTGEFPEMVIREFKGFLKGLSEEYPDCTIQWLKSDVTYL